jgi:hypothetical protein
LRLAGGADIDAADTRTLNSNSAIAATAQPGGDIVLSDPLYTAATIHAFSVIRTGTGTLDLLAGGDLTEDTPYGIYTAGTQSANVSADFQQPRALLGDGTLLGQQNAGLADAAADYQAYYPEHGGDLLLTVQGDLTGTFKGPISASNDDQIGRWLWRQGGPGMPTAWWINFGALALPLSPGGLPLIAGTTPSSPQLMGFTGIGTLGGGNVAVDVGGDSSLTVVSPGHPGGGLVIAVGGSGRVSSDGALTQTGGGYLNVKVGGELGGEAEVVNLRGDISVMASSIGEEQFDITPSNINHYDPRPRNPLISEDIGAGALTVALGDGMADIQSRGALLLAGAADPGRVPLLEGSDSHPSLLRWRPPAVRRQ